MHRGAGGVPPEVKSGQSEEINKLKAGPLLAKGLAFIESRDFESAQRAFLLALDKIPLEEGLSPQDRVLLEVRCQAGLARQGWEQGQSRISITHLLQARTVLQRSSSVSPEHGFLAYQLEKDLGMAYLDVKDCQAAISCFKQALIYANTYQKPDWAPLVSSYHGLALVLSGNSRDGMAELLKARQLFPAEKQKDSRDWISHLYLMGRAYQEAAQYHEALSEFHAAQQQHMEVFGLQKGPGYDGNLVGHIHAGLGQCFCALKGGPYANYWLSQARDSYQTIGNKVKAQEMQDLLDFIKEAAPEQPVAPHEADPVEEPLPEPVPAPARKKKAARHRSRPQPSSNSGLGYLGVAVGLVAAAAVSFFAFRGAGKGGGPTPPTAGPTNPFISKP